MLRNERKAVITVKATAAFGLCALVSSTAVRLQTVDLTHQQLKNVTRQIGKSSTSRKSESIKPITNASTSSDNLNKDLSFTTLTLAAKSKSSLTSSWRNLHPSRQSQMLNDNSTKLTRSEHIDSSSSSTNDLPKDQHEEIYYHTNSVHDDQSRTIQQNSTAITTDSNVTITIPGMNNMKNGTDKLQTKQNYKRNPQKHKKNITDFHDDDNGIFQWIEEDSPSSSLSERTSSLRAKGGKGSKSYNPTDHAVGFQGKSGKNIKHSPLTQLPLRPAKSLLTVKPSKKSAATHMPKTSVRPVSNEIETLSPTTKPTPSSVITSSPSSEPSMVTSPLPPLTWVGVNTCSSSNPCDVCTGDCELDSDCLPLFKCMQRGNGEMIQVPGCAIGGTGDMPGADYCYDPRYSDDGGEESSSPSSVTTISPTSASSEASTGGTGWKPTVPTSLPSVEVIYTFIPSSDAHDSSSMGPTLKNSAAPTSIREPSMFTSVPSEEVIHTPMPSSFGVGSSSMSPTPEYNLLPSSSKKPTISTVGPNVEIIDTPVPSLRAGVLLPSNSPSFQSSAAVSSRNPTIRTSAPNGGSTPFTLSPTRLITIPTVTSPTAVPMGFPPAISSTTPSIVFSPESSLPTMIREAFFLQSQSSMSDSKMVKQSNGWCVSGALSPDYYQLMLKACSLNLSIAKAVIPYPIEIIEQMDQLWSMDEYGLIHSIFDYSRCMFVQSNGDVVEEANVEIGPCDAENVWNKFYHDTSQSPSTLKLQGVKYASFCVTYLGVAATKGSPIIMAECNSAGKFGWNFIPVENYEMPTNFPIAAFPALKYNGRDSCNNSSPCDVCTGDCDGDDGCRSGLRCFKRGAGETSQVPGCLPHSVQNVPGADYCYDPSSPFPPLIWIGSGQEGCTKLNPCNRCTGACANDNDCKGDLECFVRKEGDHNLIPGCMGGGAGDLPGENYCFDPNTLPQPSKSPLTPSTSLAPLRWRGSDGCTQDDPCPICTGDCDEDNECEPPLLCFKRFAGDQTQIPGCEVGGLSDIPGGDFCYDPSQISQPAVSPSTSKTTSIPSEVSSPTYSPTVSLLSSVDEALRS